MIGMRLVLDPKRLLRWNCNVRRMCDRTIHNIQVLNPRNIAVDSGPMINSSCSAGSFSYASYRKVIPYIPLLPIHATLIGRSAHKSLAST